MVARCCRRCGAGGTEMRPEQRDERRHGARGALAVTHPPTREGVRRCVPTIAPGGALSDYELPDHTHTIRKLSELQGDNPLILTLARGHYCPKDHQQHLQLAAFYPQIAVAYTQMVTISTDDHHTSQ